MIPALKARFEQALSEVTKEAFDVPAIHAELDQLDQTLHSTKRKDSATLGDLQTFDDHIEMAYDFVSDRKAYLLTKVK